jgi:hypothetical protein
MFETQIWGWPITTLNPIRTDMYMFMAEQELPGKGKRAARGPRESMGELQPPGGSRHPYGLCGERIASPPSSGLWLHLGAVGALWLAYTGLRWPA